MTGAVGGSDVPPVAVWLSASCRPLRRSLRPLAWAVLEEVAFDAAIEHDRVVARTSARHIAGHLGIDPGTAASALRALRERGLLHTFREKGAAGRFGLSVYELCPVDGLGVAQPPAVLPYVVSASVALPSPATPTAVTPTTASPNMERPPTPGASGRAMTGCQISSRREGGARFTIDDAASGDDHGGRKPASITAPAGGSAQCPGQETLDFELGTSA